MEEVREVKVLEKPWVEKYRPQRLDEIVGQEHIVKRLKHYVKTGSMPHLLFAGPPGVGKTTAALALARELFGENWRHNFLELNASVSKNTPILVRINERIVRTTFAELDRLYFDESDGDVAYKDAPNLEVLTVDENYRVRWARVSKIIRHRVPVILRVHLEGGGKLELTGNHSVIVLTENGLETVKASELSEGSVLLSFTANLEGLLDVLDIDTYRIRESASEALPVSEEPSHMLAHIINTIGSHEEKFAERLSINLYGNYTYSSFDQIRFPNTQLAISFEENSYDRTRIPSFVFELPVHERIAFLRGLADELEGVIRIPSMSKDLLIDTVWLARISGIEGNLFEREARLIWKDRMKWSRADLLPAEPIVKMLKTIEHAIGGNQLYKGKKFIRKETLKRVIQMIDETRLDSKGRKILETLRKLANSDLHALVVKKVELVEYNDFVYDVSVPGNEMFFAGEIPVLLHNSDERGINVIREKVKEFARTKPIGGASFKIIFLDEADALTQDAQQALRRTMEMFSSNVRFILSCVTGDTRIYTPDEREIRIRDFIEYFENGLINEVRNRIGRDKVIATVAFNSRTVGHPVYRLTLESGRIIEATGDHMFLTPEGWKQTYDIKEGSEVLVKPTLEGTPYEHDPRPIIDVKELYDFLDVVEREHGLKPLGEAKTFRKLLTRDKERILKRALELRAEMEKGLTRKEAEILALIGEEWTTKEEIQEKAKISIVRLNQILMNLVSKGYVEKKGRGRKQLIRKLREGKAVKKITDIRRVLEEEFNMKITYMTAKKLLSGEIDGLAYRIIKEVKEKWLLRYDDEKAGILARVIGFILGSGRISKRDIRIKSRKENIEMLKEDLRRLGLEPIETTENTIHINNIAFHSLLRFWGVDRDVVPEWIRRGNLFVKREFLRGLFGAKGSGPIEEGHTIGDIKLEMSASRESFRRIRGLINDVEEMLREFGIESDVMITSVANRFIIRLIITPTYVNYLRFLTRIGYAYARDTLARLVAEYLRIKLYAETAVEMATATGTAKMIEVKKIKSAPMTFKEFVKERIFNGYIVEKVIKKEELGHLDVYDITCATDHSFISNGLISHNCNYSSKIIEPIQSRCAIFRFRPLNDEDIAKRLKFIAEQEGLELTEEGLQAILYIAEGDMRRAINILQAAAALDRKITDENVFMVASRARPEDIREMMLLALKGNFLKAREKLREILLKQGLSGEDVLVQMHREVFNLPIEEPKKVYLADKIGEYNFRLVEGANELIQLEALLAQFTLIGKK
ncbi:putative protein replication factor C small subunit [Pyrococcus sp. NA2]|uniref:AAA family ATPase n=1 Tax=Pyrococcus sp. (strain NA2) TaxID=342949 RepID=UPI000209ACA1|nr:AAA family ATPase [Pyrococcus sp. NA2]AEC51559.1 putative protein replication factor C small subunit [Pyrococcus sp. NA2]